MTDKLRELAERWAVRMDRNAKYATALMPDDSAELAEIIRAYISVIDAEGDMRPDAARYRWLRNNCKREWYSDMPHNKGAPSLDIDFSATGHGLDKAIDAAMEAK